MEEHDADDDDDDGSGEFLFAGGFWRLFHCFFFRWPMCLSQQRHFNMDRERPSWYGGT